MNFNQINLGGNLTKEPKLSFTSNQTAIFDCGMAISRKYKDKTETCFIDIRAFGKTAETMAKYLKKGNPVFVSGRLEFDQWTAQDGTKRSKHRVTVESFQFLGQGNTDPDEKPASPNADENQDDSSIPF